MYTEKTLVGTTYLSVVACKVDVMQRMMCWGVDEALPFGTGRDEHIRVVDLQRTETGLSRKRT